RRPVPVRLGAGVARPAEVIMAGGLRRPGTRAAGAGGGAAGCRSCPTCGGDHGRGPAAARYQSGRCRWRCGRAPELACQLEACGWLLDLESTELTEGGDGRP
ncbi:hypothetical protein ACV1C5_19030, partial [Aeromonas caviae]